MEDRKKTRAVGHKAEPDGNDGWFARGAGVDDEPFERSWKGARPGSENAGDSHSQLVERRAISRRDIAHDPFVKALVEERRVNVTDRRSADKGIATRRNRPSRLQ